VNRKDDHIEGALKQNFKTNDFDEVRFIHNPLSATSVDEVSLETKFLGSVFEMPVYINAMTGGSLQGYEINKRLGMLAEHFSLPLALGSIKAGLNDQKLADSFKIAREIDPKGCIMANIGGETTLDMAKKAIDLIDASMLQIHLNPAQELIMPEGDRNFNAISNNISEIVSAMKVPIVVKEVGFGMSKETVEKLKGFGITHIDISGRGGTNFADIENQRRTIPMEYLNDWGQSTVESLLEASQVEDITIIASGGVRNALDVVKALRLGASMVGMSGFFLKLVKHNTHEESVNRVERFIREIKKIMVLIGANSIEEIAEKPIVFSPKLIHYMEQRQLKGIL
jgi:isopentenyl-diphosphate delta-isomerase